MIKTNKHIEIVRSSQSGLSSLSLASSQMILAVLKRHYTTAGVTTVNNQADLQALVAKQPDLVFMGMKYLPGPAGPIWLSSFLDQHDIPHTGSSQSAIQFELNKSLAKRRVLEAGLKTACFEVIKNHQSPTDIGLSFPLFVKPTSLGGGEGIDEASVVNNLPQLAAKVAALQQRYSTDVLIEEYLPGREFSVAILKDKVSHEFMAMPLELVAPANSLGDCFLSQSIKSLDQETFLPVAESAIRTQVTNLALEVFTALGARDYGRIDIRLDAKGEPHFLEANLIPSLLRDYGNFPKACWLNIGMDYQTMILHIVDLGLNRATRPIPALNELAPLFSLQPLPVLVG